MSSSVIDTYKLLTSLKATGKDADYTAEEIANAIDVAQDTAELLTVSVFETRMSAHGVKLGALDARMEGLDARMGSFHAKLDTMRADIKAEVKSSQMQNLLWLAGITLVSNGMVIAVLARAAKLY
jgi:hypothetical protein